jgi:hypothetical protein
MADLTFPLDEGARGEVRRCIHEYVDSLKTQGWPPERVLVGLKRIAEEVGIRSKILPAREGRASRTDLVMDMVAWSIERYYAPKERTS